MGPGSMGRVGGCGERRLLEWGAADIEVGSRVPARFPADLIDTSAEDDRVVEIQISRPDELRTFKVRFIVGRFGVNPLLGVLGGVRPVAVIKLDRKPICRDRGVLDSRVFNLAVQGAFKKIFSLPRGVGNGAIAEFYNEAAVADVVAVFEARFGISIILGHDSDGHRVLR